MANKQKKEASDKYYKNLLQLIDYSNGIMQANSVVLIKANVSSKKINEQNFINKKIQKTKDII